VLYAPVPQGTHSVLHHNTTATNIDISFMVGRLVTTFKGVLALQATNQTARKTPSTNQCISLPVGFSGVCQLDLKFSCTATKNSLGG
jgi:hypothetical protein